LKTKVSRPSSSADARHPSGITQPNEWTRERKNTASSSSRAWRLLLSFASGAALALGFPNFNLPLFGWIAVAGLIIASLRGGLGEAAWRGLLFGTAFYLFSVPWIYTVMRQYGPLPSWEAAGVMALMILAASPYFVAFTLLMTWVARRNINLAVLAAPFLWVALELARTRMPDIAFPWNLLGYTASGSLALVQLTSVTGIYGLSLLVASYNAVLVWLMRSRGNGAWRRPAGILSGFTAIVVAAIWIGPRFVPAAEASRVAHLVQTNLPQALDYPANWDEIHASDMAELERITIAAGQKEPGLVVWPEVPAPFSLRQTKFANLAQEMARESKSYFLLGVVDWRPAPGGNLNAYNSAAMLDPASRLVFQYDKIHLVPFSEYVPWRDFFWFAKDLTGLAGEFHSGTEYSVGGLPGGRFSVLICYEAVFPNEVRRFVRGGANLLVNISNDGWFGRSAARAQHLAMARVRAVEYRRWLLRDTNNGFTASVDPYGRIVARLAPDIRGELDAPYAFRTGETLYARRGDWLAWLCVVISVVVVVLAGVGARPFRAAKSF
jgi:apolipoprotein N-acyltransferase